MSEKPIWADTGHYTDEYIRDIRRISESGKTNAAKAMKNCYFFEKLYVFIAVISLILLILSADSALIFVANVINLIFSLYYATHINQKISYWQSKLEYWGHIS